MIREIKSIKELQPGDWIAFQWNYNGGVGYGKDIEVAQITSCGDGYMNISFLYGYKSICETVKAEQVIAIGSSIGDYHIKLWSHQGKFVCILPNHPTLLAWQEEYKDR